MWESVEGRRGRESMEEEWRAALLKERPRLRNGSSSNYERKLGGRRKGRRRVAGGGGKD